MQHDVGGRDEPVERRLAGSAVEVERDRFLAAVVDVKGQRVVVAESGPHVAGIVAAVMALDLDHVGTEIGEDGPA